MKWNLIFEQNRNFEAQAQLIYKLVSTRKGSHSKGRELAALGARGWSSLLVSMSGGAVCLGACPFKIFLDPRKPLTDILEH